MPQQEAWIVERFGKFHRVLDPGLAVLAPFVDTIRHVKTLKESLLPRTYKNTDVTRPNADLDFDKY